MITEANNEVLRAENARLRSELAAAIERAELLGSLLVRVTEQRDAAIQRAREGR